MLSQVVAFGGGALLNVTGLFASMLYRGSKVIYVPTTLLAMHDVRGEIAETNQVESKWKGSSPHIPQNESDFV